MPLTPTNIEYGMHNWAIVRGCLHKPQGKCPVTNCWAEFVSKRQGWDFHKPELLVKNLLDPLKRKKPTRILVNFSGDLFGDWVDPKQIPNDRSGYANSSLAFIVLDIIKRSPQHTFLFLTKNPSGIWDIEWPDNAWMGATAWDFDSFVEQTGYFLNIPLTVNTVKAKHKWLSFEPLLGGLAGYKFIFDRLRYSGISWLVIGAEDHPLKLPRREWVTEIESACIEAGIPYWEKNNLATLFPDRPLHQELPR
jgi:protein gp37